MYELRPYQAEAKQAILSEWSKGYQKTLLVLPTGCHKEGESLLTANGATKRVEDIKEGDRLLGADGQARTVLFAHSGEGDLYSVKPIKGKAFTVTGDHKLTLVRVSSDHSAEGTEMIDVPVMEWLAWSKSRQEQYKLVRSGPIESFPDDTSTDADRPIDPYFLGVLLGDGGLHSATNVTTMDPEIVDEIYKQAAQYKMNVRLKGAGQADTFFLTKRYGDNRLASGLSQLGLIDTTAGTKFVPNSYKFAQLRVRLEVIAGLIDTDGSLCSNGYDYISKSDTLANDLAFMCRSVGLAAYVKAVRRRCQTGFEGTYYRVRISGDCDRIPCRVAHKKASERRQVKSALRTGLSITSAGRGPYYGFTVDGDNRYLLDDFTITHNCGKTVVFASVAKEQVDRGHRVLIMAHRGELLTQAAGKLKEAVGLDSALEKADSSCLGSFYPVVVGSVQSLCQSRRLEAFPSDYFQDIIVDEAHHCLSTSYQKVLDHFPDANVLGVTATPDRGDMKNLGEFFDSKAYEYSMTQAIREKYLCPIQAQMIPLQLDIRNVGVSNGDFNAGEIGGALEPYLEQIVQEMLHYCQGRRTVVFLPLVATSQRFCEMLNEAGLSAAEVNGNSPDRAEVLRDFENGRYDVLCNSMLLTEGWDCPAVDCIVVLRPTKVRSLYQQMLGRGMRLAPGKDHLLLLDFLWMTERHDLCKPSSLISRDADIAESIDEQIRKSSGAVDLMDAEAQAERDALAEREDSLAQELAAMRAKKRKLVDPIQYALSIAAEDLANYEPTFAWEMGPPSEKQLNYLERCGIYPDSIENAGMASMLISRLRRRSQEGLSTPKQIRCLERYGFKRVGTWQFDEASMLISQLAENRWRVPRGIVPERYRP